MNEQQNRAQIIEMHELRAEVSRLKGEVSKLRHEKTMLVHQGALQQMVSTMNQPLRDLASDIRAHQNTQPAPVFSEIAIESAFARIDAKEADRIANGSIPKLIAKLAFRITLVIALAVGVLAVFA